MAERIENLLNEKEQLVGAQRRLVRDVSHELRSPLARLGVALELARDRIEEAVEDVAESTTPSPLVPIPAPVVVPPAPRLATNNGTSMAETPHKVGTHLATYSSGEDTSYPGAIKLHGDKALPLATSMTEALDRIERETSRLSEMIDRLLVLTRMESGVQTPEAIKVDLGALVRAIAADADFEARPTQRVVNISTCDDCTIHGTPDLLRSAVENVVRNAVRYTPQDTSVEINLRHEVRPGPEAGTVSDDKWAVIKVQDQGPGIPEAELKEVFQPFYRASGARERQSGGVGIGLAITDRAVRLHGGSVEASNAEGRGLIIEIRLPLDQDSIKIPQHLDENGEFSLQQSSVEPNG